MASAKLAYPGDIGGVDDVWKVATELQRARNFRRMSQPAPVQSYRRDSFTREPFQNYRRDSLTRDILQNRRNSITRDSTKDYRRDSLTRDPTRNHWRDSITSNSVHDYLRDSITKEPYQNYRRDSITKEPYQNYRRDSVTKDPIQNYRRDSFTRDSVTREPTEQSNSTSTGRTSRRASDADDINWIAKYNRSDHHTDRLVNTKLEHEKAIARSFSATPDDRANRLNTPSAFSSAITNNQLNHTSQLPPKPFHYEGTNKLTVFLQPMVQTTPRSYPSSQPTVEDRSRSINQRRSSETLSPSSGYPRLPPVSATSSRIDYMGSVPGDRFSRPSSLAGSSLPLSSVFRRRYSVDSSLLRTSRGSAFTPVIPTPSTYSDLRASPAIGSQFSADRIQSQPYRPSFTRAPSLPPSLQPRPPSSLPLPPTSLITNGFSRPYGEGLTNDFTRRRFSLANVPDLSTPNYRRSVDLSALKSTTGGFKSSNLSAFGSDLHPRSSYETLSSLSPTSPSHLPPPSERIFGSRGTHTSLRRNRRSVVDSYSS